MRRVFLRAVLLGALAAFALIVARRVWAETIVIVCTSATEPSPRQISVDTERKFVVVDDVALSTRDLYPLDDVSPAAIDAMLARFQREGKYQCRRAP